MFLYMGLGKIEVAVGPMFSGKSEWLVSKLRVHEVAKKKILAICHASDDRYKRAHISSHNKSSYKAKEAKNTQEVSRLINLAGKFNVFAIDELQFFEPEIVDLIVNLQKMGVNIYASGLDLDFRGQPWETTVKLLAFADTVEKLVAVCSVCNSVNATRTQRLSNNNPAPKKGPRVLIGGKDSYTARCILHHQV